MHYLSVPRPQKSMSSKRIYQRGGKKGNTEQGKQRQPRLVLSFHSTSSSSPSVTYWPHTWLHYIPDAVMIRVEEKNNVVFFSNRMSCCLLSSRIWVQFRLDHHHFTLSVRGHCPHRGREAGGTQRKNSLPFLPHFFFFWPLSKAAIVPYLRK